MEERVSQPGIQTSVRIATTAGSRVTLPLTSCRRSVWPVVVENPRPGTASHRESLIDEATLPCFRPRVAFRRIARATGSRTTIAALVPPRVVLTDVAPYLVFARGDERDEAYLLGVLCSIPFDWGARRVVETHMDFHVLDGLSVPNAERDSPIRNEVERLAGRLAAVDARYSDWADAVGVEVASVSNHEQEGLVARLDAAVARLYGLTEDDVKVVFETFHVGWDRGPRLAAVLDHYRDLA